MNYFGFYPLSKAMSRLNKRRLTDSMILLVWTVSPCTLLAAPSELAQICAAYTENKADEAATATAADMPYGQGVLWRIEVPDTDPSYLFGTIHSQDRRVAGGLEPPVRLALARSQRLLIEVVPDAKANKVYRQAIYSNTGPGLDEELPKPLYDRLRQIGKAYGLPPERLDQVAPWAAFSQIGRPRPVTGPTQDMLVYQTAEQSGKPVIGLESMTELTETLASLPRADQLTILKDTLCNHEQIVRDSEKMLAMYLAGDLAAMVAFNEQPHNDEAVFERFMNAVMDARNERMLERMLPYIERGGSFIAVGALHLPDEDGLLKRLEREGYKLTRDHWP